MKALFVLVIVFLFINSIQSVVDCDSTYACSDNNTCCRFSGGAWGCCPYTNAVCCSTTNKCCPAGSYCTNTGCGSRLLTRILKNSMEK